MTLYHCWTIIHRAVHHPHPHIHRAVHHALHHKAITATIVCVAVGTPFLATPDPQAQPPPTAYSGQPSTGPDISFTGTHAPPLATQQNTMPPTLDQLFPSLEQIPFSNIPDTLPTTFPEIPTTPNQVPEPSSLAIFLIPLAVLYLLINRRSTK